MDGVSDIPSRMASAPFAPKLYVHYMRLHVHVQLGFLFVVYDRNQNTINHRLYVLRAVRKSSAWRAWFIFILIVIHGHVLTRYIHVGFLKKEDGWISQ